MSKFSYLIVIFFSVVIGSVLGFMEFNKPDAILGQVLKAEPQNILFSYDEPDVRCDKKGENCVKVGTAKRYAYRTNKEIPVEPNEVVEQRTPQAKVFKTDKPGEFQAKFVSSIRYNKDSQGKWWYVEQATTTPETIALALKRPWYKRLFGEQARADTFTPAGDGLMFSTAYGLGSGVAYTTLVADDGTGGSVDMTSTTANCVVIRSDNVSGQWRWNGRCGATFSTGPTIPDTATVTATSLAVVSNAKGDPNSITPDINVYGFTPSNDTTFAVTDYAQCGTTAYSTAIAYADWPVSGSTATFNGNATFIAAVSKTGNTKLCLRNANYDVANQNPAGSTVNDSSIVTIRTSENAGSEPVLTVTYTVAGGVIAPSPIFYE